MEEIKVEIEKVRERLYALVNRDNQKLTSKDIVYISQQLDVLINKYYC